MLPRAAQNLYQKTNKQVIGRVGADKADKIAWGVVKSKFVKEGDNWIAKSADLGEESTKVIIAKSVMMSPKVVRDTVISKSLDTAAIKYYADFVIGTSDDDGSDDLLSEAALKGLPEHMVGDTLDLEHYSLKEAQGKKTPEGIEPGPIAKIIDAKVVGKELINRLEYNPHHKNFREVWDKTVDGWIGASLEVYPIPGKSTWDGTRKVHSEVKYRRVSLTDNPQNRYTKVLRAWKQAG